MTHDDEDVWRAHSQGAVAPRWDADHRAGHENVRRRATRRQTQPRRSNERANGTSEQVADRSTEAQTERRRNVPVASELAPLRTVFRLDERVDARPQLQLVPELHLRRERGGRRVLRRGVASGAANVASDPEAFDCPARARAWPRIQSQARRHPPHASASAVGRRASASATFRHLALPPPRVAARRTHREPGPRAADADEGRGVAVARRPAVHLLGARPAPASSGVEVEHGRPAACERGKRFRAPAGAHGGVGRHELEHVDGRRLLSGHREGRHGSVSVCFPSCCGREARVSRLFVGGSKCYE